MKKARSTYLALIAVLMSPVVANADLITVTGAGSNDGIWEITLVEDTFENIMADLTDQVWWGDSALAVIFADTLGPVAGVNNLSLNFGPLFLWGASFGDGYELLKYSVYQDGAGAFESVYTFYETAFSLSLVYATATRVPEPGTLTLLGIGLVGMALVRRRKLA